MFGVYKQQKTFFQVLRPDVFDACNKNMEAFIGAINVLRLTEWVPGTKEDGNLEYNLHQWR